MKKLTALLLLLAAGTYAGAQSMDTVLLVQKARKFKPGEHILMTFEVLDTVDMAGKKSTMSRSYYFDKQNRMISSVRETNNPKNPDQGTQVIYSFAANKLTAVTVIPPKATCKNCASQYYYYNDSLTSKKENGYTTINPSIFIEQAHFFQSKLPTDLPWGYFDDEIIVNGKKKKIKSPY